MATLLVIGRLWPQGPSRGLSSALTEKAQGLCRTYQRGFGWLGPDEGAREFVVFPNVAGDLRRTALL